MLNKKLLGSVSSLPQDDNFENVTLLLNGDGTNGGQNNTFVDSSTNNFTITRNGNTTQGSFSPYGSNWSNYFDGNGDYFNVSSISSATGDFTFSFWMFATGFGTQGNGTVVGASSGSNIFSLQTDSTTPARILGYVGVATGAGNLSPTLSQSVLNRWIHIVIVRSGSTITFYENGTSVATATNSNTINFNSGFQIGAYVSQYNFEGYLSNIKLVIGTANVPSGVPTAPSIDTTNTQLLTCQSNRFVDNSSSPKTLTVNGNPSVQRFSPFEPSAPYSTSVIGGSCTVDGTGDYLQFTNTLDVSGTFTIEGWFYPTTLSFPAFDSGVIIASNKNSGSGVNGIGLALYNTGELYFFLGNGAASVANPTIAINQWHHFAYVYDGTTVSAYLNGTRVGTSAQTIVNNSQITTIGQSVGSVNWDASVRYIGIIGQIRATNTQVYTGTTYTVPTSPLTAISGTNYLINMTNASIADLAMQNNLETVGNAQVSTSVKKYGTGSLAFDGTGDEIQITRANPAFDIAGSTHCVELWIYPTSWATGEEGDCFLCFGTNTSTNSGQFRQKFGDRLQYYIGSTINMETSVIPSINTWSHIVATYDASASRARIFIDGVLRATQSTSSSAIGSPLVLTLGVELNSLKRNYFNGYMDDVRITRGVIPSLYQTTSTTLGTTVFTPPSAPLPIY